jgi:drug/metabolite transporter (DMT)-like permease
MAIVLALCAASVFGVADYCGGRASRSVSPMVVTVLGQSAGFVVLLSAALLVRSDVPPLSDWLWGGLAGVAGASGLLAFYRAMGSGFMTVVAPISAVTSTSLPILIGLATGERPGILALLAIPLALVAVALVSDVLGPHHRRAPRKILLFALVSGLAFGTVYVILGNTHSDGGLWPVVAMRLTSIPFMTIVMLSARRRPSEAKGNLPIVFASGILDSTANALYLLAAREGMLSIVATINSLYPASTLMLATQLDRERIHRPQVLGLLIAIVALVFIALS